MEETIHDELKKFLNYLGSMESTPLEILGKFNLPVLNVLWRITIKQSFEYDDPKLLEIMDVLTRLFKSGLIHIILKKLNSKIINTEFYQDKFFLWHYHRYCKYFLYPGGEPLVILHTTYPMIFKLFPNLKYGFLT